jgi:hypothetical protein
MRGEPVVSVYERAVGWTAWIGCLAGTASAVLLACGGTLPDGEWDAFGLLAVIMTLYGAPIGVVVGWVVGLPVVAAASVLRRHTSRWRGVSATLGGLGVLVPAVALLGTAPAGLLLAPASAAGAWWGLGRVFRDAPTVAASQEASTLSR